MDPDALLHAATQDLRILAEAAFAIFCGGLIGWEREAAGKWAGLRTNILVCLAAFLFVQVGQLIVVHSAAVWSVTVFTEQLRADPIRIVQSIVVGISFVGAGAVFRDPDRNVARGLTSAATLLVVAPIGIAVALEHYVLALGTSVLVVLILHVLNWVERRLFATGRHSD